MLFGNSRKSTILQGKEVLLLIINGSRGCMKCTAYWFLWLGGEAFSTWCRNRFDVVLFSLMMWRSAGYATCRTFLMAVSDVGYIDVLFRESKRWRRLVEATLALFSPRDRGYMVMICRKRGCCSTVLHWRAFGAIQNNCALRSLCLCQCCVRHYLRSAVTMQRFLYKH